MINPSNGVVISGTAEAGATVTLTDAGGNPIGQVTADGSGNWSFTPGTPLANGTVIVATATDPTGNTGPQAATTVDAVAPPAPVIDPSNGTTISGTAEAGAKVILTDGNGNPIGETTADGSGNWTFTPATPLANGTVVNAVPRTLRAIPAGQHYRGRGGAEHACGQSEQRQPAQRYRRAGQHRDLDRRQRQPDRPDHRRWQRQLELHARLATQRHRGQRDRERRRRQYQPSRYHDGGFLTAVDPAGGSEQRLGDQRTADAGNTIIITDGNGNPIGQVTADGSGNWSFTPGIPLPDGTVVNVVARSPSNVDSAPAVITVDGGPAAPVIDPSNGTEISGTAEAGATVILTDGGGNPIGQATADGSGNWTFTPGTPLANGTVINAVAQDPAGNTSGPASTTVDAVAPATPVVNPSNGSVIAGTAEAGATVILTDGGGNDRPGHCRWQRQLELHPGHTAGQRLGGQCGGQDAAGNTSGPASTTVDSVAPATPVLDPSNGTVISGTAEAGATVILTDGGGNPIGRPPPMAAATGASPGHAAGQRLGDQCGGPGRRRQHQRPGQHHGGRCGPGHPVIDPSNGVELSGTAEPGVRVILTDGNGNPIGQTLADGGGNWSFTPGTPLANGTVVNAVAQDPAGNTSGPASTTVDTVAPATPVINASNGSVITGTAEVGAKVILTDGNGNPIGETTADGSGNWTFTPARRWPTVR